MLKARRVERRKKLAKYMNRMGKKSTRLPELYEEVLVKEEQAPEAPQPKIEIGEVEQKGAWEDSDDEAIIDLNSHNMLKKLKKGDDKITQKELRKRLTSYQSERYAGSLGSWAQSGAAHEQKDYEDILHEDIIESVPSNRVLAVEYVAKSKKPHGSIVTGVQWRNKVFFSTGLDKTIRAWTFDEKAPDFSRSLSLLKTVYTEDLPLTSCNILNDRLYMGTLRKNYVVFDMEKSVTKLTANPYLSEHKNFSQLRADSNYVGIYSKGLLSILSKNNQFIGQLKANEELVDVCISNNEVYGVTKEAIYQWDIRKLRASQVVRQGLDNTTVKLCNGNGILAVGTRSGVTYLYSKNELIGEAVRQIDNLVTSVSGLCVSDDGNFLVPFSRWKRNACRLFDVRDMSVLSSWPSMHTKLNYPTAAGFSRSAGYLAVGSANGQVGVYNLQASGSTFE